MKHILDSIYETLKVVQKSRSRAYKASLKVVEKRITAALVALPQFSNGIHTLRKFLTGIFKLSWVSAEDHIAMYQQLIFAIGFATTEYDPQSSDCFGSRSAQLHCVKLLDLVSDISRRLHTTIDWYDSDLDTLETDLATMLSEWEGLNTVANALIPGEKTVSLSGKQKVGCLHSLRRSIEDTGAPRNTSAAVGEKCHIPVKATVERSKGKNRSV